MLFFTGNSLKEQRTTGTNIYNQNIGNVGINTIDPGSKLTVNETFSFGGRAGNLDPRFIAFNNFSYLANTGQMIMGVNITGGDGEADFINNMGGGYLGGYSFYEYRNDHTLKHLLRLTGDGNLGVGVLRPNTKLQVNSDNIGSGINNWIAANLGATNGDRVRNWFVKRRSDDWCS